MTAPLSALLEARSVAVVGASARPGSVGNEMVRQVRIGDEERPVYPVNPRYEEVEGLRCYQAIEDVPEPVDLVLLGVSNERLEEHFVRAAKAGARAAVIFSSVYEDPLPGVPPLKDRIRDSAIAHGMAVCGGNCMGFVNNEAKLRALAFAEREALEAGPIAFMSHSGSVFTAMLHNLRGLRFNLAVSTGQELTTSVSDYVDYALSMGSTRVIALFLETVRDPERFKGVLGKAAENDVPVVALKVGVEEAATRLVEAHSGALAGSDGAYEAVFDHYGVLRVDTLSEMADVLELASSGRRARAGGLTAIHDSGGERAHLIDVAAQVGIPFASLSPDTTMRLRSLLDPGLPAVNPLDAWGTGRDYERVFRDCMMALMDDPGTAAFAFAVDLAGEELEAGYSRAAIDVFRRTDLPFAVVSNMPSAISPEIGAQLRGAGVPVLEGTATGLSAFKHLLAYRDYRARAPVDEPPGPPAEVVLRWRRRLGDPRALDEVEALDLLRAYGIPVVTSKRATDPEGAAEAAAAIGYPVVLKTRGPAHKSDAGGVCLDLPDEDSLRRAYADVAARLGPDVVVAEMVEPGVELALGVVNDEQFGPLVLAGAGGTLVEVVRDRAVSLPPLDRARARDLLSRSSVDEVLHAARGRSPVDMDGVLDAIVGLSALARDLGDSMGALDVNPLVCGPGGVVAVDALVAFRANR